MPRVCNLTPIELAVSAQRHGAPASDAGPFATVDIPPPADRIYVQRRGGDLTYPIAAIPATAPDQTVSITVDRLRSSTDPTRGFSRTRTFRNCTAEVVDVILAADSPSRVATLFPGGQHVDDNPYPQVWVVRCAFTDEVVTAFADDDDQAHRAITYEITDDFRQRLARHNALPSPLPGNRPVVLIGGARETPPPEDRTYISIDNRDGRLKPEFNGVKNVIPRRVKIVGAKVIWDKNNDTAGLMSLQGDKVLDLESLEIVADEVIIASPLRFPGTNVSIYARRVEFGEDGVNDGIIDTTPPELPPVEYIPRQPRPKTPPKVTDGAAGPPGGSVTLVAHTLVTGDPTTIRVRTRGGKGGKAEPGDKLAYTRRDTRLANTVAPEETANCTVVKQSDIANRLPGWFQTAGSDAKYLSGWLWPGGHSEPGRCVYNGKPLGLGDKDNAVTSLVVSAHDNRFFGLDMNWFQFPAATGQDGRWHRDEVYWDAGQFESYTRVIPTPVIHRVPGDGADAYAGGQPGNGGAGGTVWTTAEFRDVVARISQTPGGEAGPPTEKVDGAPPGTPEVALLVDMAIVRTGSPRPEPRMWVREYRAQPGKPGEAKTATPGADGSVQVGGGSWVRAEAIDAVLAYARAAFRDGNRDDAQRAIAPYYALFRSPLITRNNRFAAQVIAVNAMRENLLANVDYYGNPPGWLPRLRLSTNLELFEAVRKASYQLLYFATTTEEKFDDLAHRRTLASEVRSALNHETAACRKAIAAAATQLADARLELAKIVDAMAYAQQDIDKLKNFAEQDAVAAHERQRIFKGVMAVVGGAMQAIPVGQPYLGAGGGLISGIGEIDFFTSDKPAERAAEALTKLGEATDSFLDENIDLIAADRVATLRDEFNLGKKNVKKLKDQVDQATGEAARIEQDVEQYTKPIQDKRIEDLTARRDKLVLDKETVEEAIAAYGSGEKAEDVVKEVPVPKTPKAAALDRDLQGLTNRIRAVDTEMKELEAGDAKRNAKRLVRLRLERNALTDAEVRAEKLQASKDAAEAKVEEIEEEADAKQQRYTEAMGRLKTMGKGIGSIGAGIATLATPVARDDQAVQDLAANLLKSVDPVQYQKLLKDMAALGKRQTTAMEQLTRAQSIINTNVARMAESLTAQSGLGRQLHSLDTALDARAKQYLRGMRQRAEDMLHSSMYYLVMSYRYEALQDLPDSFVNYDRVVAALQALEKASAPAGSGDDKPTTLQEAAERLTIDMTNPSDGDLKRLDDIVLKFEFLKLGLDVAQKRQYRAASKTHIIKLALKEDQLRQLNNLGAVTFNLVEHFSQGENYTVADGRIAGITLKKVVVDSDNDALNMRVDFLHSGESIINEPNRSGQPVYYYFRAAHTDDPVAWSFQATTPEDEDQVSGSTQELDIVADKKVDGDLEEFLAKGLDEAKVELNEYWPSLFSDITLAVGWEDQAPTEKITELRFDVKLSQRLTGKPGVRPDKRRPKDQPVDEDT
ncbi:MAG: hypothetical protein JST91_04210 [Actinobacteria bacterium]|nr:hypothetical protein [Actinomycetota bacterium]